MDADQAKAFAEDLKAEVVPYSSVVGSSVTLLDAAGRVRGVLAIMNGSPGMDADQQKAIAKMTALAINGMRHLREHDKDPATWKPRSL